MYKRQRCEMLDAANPETIDLVSKVFDEYMLKDPKLGRPVFADCLKLPLSILLLLKTT